MAPMATPTSSPWRHLRNSKAAVIYEGTSQLHTLIAADYLLGYREDRRHPDARIARAGGRALRLRKPIYGYLHRE